MLGTRKFGRQKLGTQHVSHVDWTGAHCRPAVLQTTVSLLSPRHRGWALERIRRLDCTNRPGAGGGQFGFERGDIRHQNDARFNITSEEAPVQRSKPSSGRAAQCFRCSPRGRGGGGVSAVLWVTVECFPHCSRLHPLPPRFNPPPTPSPKFHEGCFFQALGGTVALHTPFEGVQGSTIPPPLLPGGPRLQLPK